MNDDYSSQIVKEEAAIGENPIFGRPVNTSLSILHQMVSQIFGCQAVSCTYCPVDYCPVDHPRCRK